MKTTIIAGITSKGNFAATTEDRATRFLINQKGELLEGSSLNFPDHILEHRVTVEEDESAESIFRRYVAQRQMEIEQEKAVKQIEEDAAAREMARMYGSLDQASKSLKIYHDGFWKREKFINPSDVAALRRALKKAEAKAAAQKEMAAWVKLCKKTVKSLNTKAPASPLKGHGFAREDFSAGNNKKLQALFAAIPASHKDEISSRRQKGYFSWSSVISPEAAKKIEKLVKLATV